jgi:hypothetical protein
VRSSTTLLSSAFVPPLVVNTRPRLRYIISIAGKRYCGRCYSSHKPLVFFVLGVNFFFITISILKIIVLDFRIDPILPSLIKSNALFLFYPLRYLLLLQIIDLLVQHVHLVFWSDNQISMIPLSPITNTSTRRPEYENDSKTENGGVVGGSCLSFSTSSTLTWASQVVDNSFFHANVDK